MDKITTSSNKETQKLGQDLARRILAEKSSKTAVVLALTGDLGAGKTTFLQGFAKGLGIGEVVNSPTFIIMKKFEISKEIASFLRPQKRRYRYFYHFDLYRLENEKDLEFLHFAEIISDPKNIIAVEWPEKIEGILPKNSVKIIFKHLEENKREIAFDF